MNKDSAEVILRVDRKYDLALINHNNPEKPQEEVFKELVDELKSQNIAEDESLKIARFLLSFAYPKSSANEILGLQK